jgi:hypothetical protein
MSEPVARKIVINGKEYASTDEMPPEIRAVYEEAMSVLADRDANGVPDLLEGKGPGVWQAAKQIWSVARAAHKSGIQSVTFTGGVTTSSTRTPSLGSTPAPAARRPVGPAEVGPSKLRQLVFAIVVAIVIAIVLKQLGWIE